MTSGNNDLELLTRIRSGDKSACDDCVRRHASGVYRLSLRLMKNKAEAEDVVQETFLNAFKGIDRFEGRAGLRTWLYRIAYNAAMARLRRKEPELALAEEGSAQETGTPLPKELFDWRSLPEQQLERAELRAEMEKAIWALPEKLRTVFVLRELEGLSTEETAGTLGIRAQAVKTRLHRARLQLRERLSSYFASEASARRG